jgi:hypothetical protein
MHTNAAHFACHALSALAISAGAAGMAVSFLFLASTSFEDITAGTSGFVAGAILIGSGLVALALLSRGAATVAAGHVAESGAA